MDSRRATGNPCGVEVGTRSTGLRQSNRLPGTLDRKNPSPALLRSVPDGTDLWSFYISTGVSHQTGPKNTPPWARETVSLHSQVIIRRHANFLEGDWTGITSECPV